MNSVMISKKRKHLFFSLYCLIFTAFLFLGFYSKVSAETVDEIEINGLDSITKDELLYLLDIHPAKPIDKESIRLGIKRAFRKGIFENISVETTDGEKTKVIINVKERDFIEDIDIEGDYDLSNKNIRQLFLLKEGQVIRCDMLDKAVTDLKQNLAIRGFPHAIVHAQTERLEEPHRVNILLHIDTGKPERIKKINISGADDEVKSVMKLSEGDIYDQTVIQKDLDRIKTFYLKKGYFKPTIGPYSFINGNLDISVQPGKRLHIIIIGNDAISTKALIKEVPFFELEEFNDDIVEEAIHRMLSLYHKEGRPFAQIAPVITSKNDLIDVAFYIFEGEEVTVGKISFAGNTFPEEKLKEIMSLKQGHVYDPDLIDKDKESLVNLYYALGYLSADIEEFHTEYDEVSHQMNINLKIKEGLKTEIGTIKITGARLIPETEIQKAIKLKQGDVYNEVDISDARYRIINLYNTRGLINTEVSIKRELIGQKADITFQIVEGDEISFGKTIITGNYDTKYKVIERELEYKEDTPFDPSALNKARHELYKLGLFTSVDIETLDRYDHKKDVLIHLNEGDAGAIEFGIGYTEYEKFRGFLDLSYKNLWGTNTQSSIRVEMSTIENRLILQYYEPWFWGIKLPFRALLLSEYREEINLDTKDVIYKLTRHTATAGFEKKFGNNIKAELYYDFSLVNTYDVKPDVILSKEDTGTLVISGIRPGIIYDTRNNPFNPSKGILSGISLKFTSPFFLSETDFIKLNFYGNVYHKLIKGTVLAVSLRGGIAQGYLKTRELPIVERFFLGGRTTVRGYDQDTLGPKGSDGNPTGGNAFLMENLEIRTPLSKDFGIVAFLDGGNVWKNIKEINPADFKFTTGLGLRYNTPVGPIRVDYGVKLHREKGESIGVLHFSIGQAF
jgi:outer membrane protein insertion porin family